MLQEGVLAILQVLRVRLIITEVSLKQNCDFFFFFFFFFFFSGRVLLDGRLSNVLWERN